MAAGQTQLYAYLINSIQDDFPASSARKALIIIGATMLGTSVGAFGSGSLADTRGCKFSLLVSFTLTHFAGALCAASPTAGVLIVFRFVVGVGFSGQQPIICALIMEVVPTNIRGRALVYLNAFWPVGDFFAWLAASGKIDDAVRVLRSIEEMSSVFYGKEMDDATRNLAEHHDASEDANAAVVWFFCMIILCVTTAIFVFGIETANHNSERPWRRTSNMATNRL